MPVYGLRKETKYDANSLKPIKFLFFRIELYKYGHLYSLNHIFSALIRINMDMNTDYYSNFIVYNRINTFINTDRISFFQF